LKLEILDIASKLVTDFGRTGKKETREGKIISTPVKDDGFVKSRHSGGNRSPENF
jgi:hypothetical protein